MASSYARGEHRWRKAPGTPKSRTKRLRLEPLEHRHLLAVVINEIHYNSADNTSFEEFIELHNTAATAVDLSGWRFSDGVEFTFAPGTQIAAGGYVVVGQNPAVLQSEFGITAVGQYVGNLNNEGERLALADAQGFLIDEVEYGTTFPWPIAADGNGASMELINPNLDNNQGSNWRPSYTVPLFGEPEVDDPPTGSGALNDLVHRWSFNGNLIDSVGTADGTLVSPQDNAFFSNGELSVSSNNSGTNSNQNPFTNGSYVDLPNGIISSLGGDATFEWWGTLTSNRLWAEIFSFGRSVGGENIANGAANQEYITLIPLADSGSLRVTHRDGGTGAESAVNWNQTLNTNTEYHLAVTWDDVTDTQKLYVNGVLVGTSSLIIDLIDIEDTNNWLGRSQWADPLFDGRHNEFRIYGRALTSTEIASSFTAGPNAVAQGPTINSFAASDTEILVGESVTLSWNVTGATTLSIQGVGNVTGQNQIVVAPATSTTYYLSATNAQGTSVRSVRVQVDYPRATPGATNNVYAANAAPTINDVTHTANPTSATAGTVTAEVADPNGVASVQLQYQIVLPGDYIPARLPVPHDDLIADGTLLPTANPEYFDLANWTTVTMVDNGTGGDAVAGDGIYTGVIPAQAHRTLVRYRLIVTDSLGASATAPYADDMSLNFAYFVYNGIPDYRNNSNQVLADAEDLASLPVYHFLTRAEDMAEAQAYDGADEIPQGYEARFTYNWSGAMVYNGVVYDNITYRLRGANGRYLTDGKRSMRFRFNDGNWFEPLDQYGNAYSEKWKTLTTGKGFDNRQTLTYALNEAMTMLMSNMMGLPAPDTHWFQFRVIDGAQEAPDQWNGDFWGINFALEDYDKRFLDAHGLEAGNLYKLINQTNDALRQQDYQAPNAVSDGSDHDYVEQFLTRASTDIEFRVNMQKYFVFRAIAEAVRHYDYWADANKNMTYYFEPDYTAENDYLGKLWLMFWDTDATWGPTWNEGIDLVTDAVFYNNDPIYRNELLKPEYYNTIRELRDLIWQPDQIEGLLEELVSAILPLEAADRARWQGAPASAGNYNGLSGAGTVSLTALVQDMLNFAFVGGNWPGGSVGTGGRAAYLDGLLSSSGEESLIPLTPTITYTGDPSMAANLLAFQASNFNDPQGAGTFGAMEWRIAPVTSAAAGLDPNAKFLAEWDASWESGEIATYSTTIDPPTFAVSAGQEYRARIRYQDNTGRWSHWSAPVSFVAAPADNLNLILDHLRIGEIYYNAPAGDPLQGEDDVPGEEFEYLEFVNTSTTETLDLSGVQIQGGLTFTFANGTLVAPGGRLLVVEDEGNFESRFGEGLPVVGEWTGALSNGGEELIVLTNTLDEVQRFDYDDVWHPRTDGGGLALSIIDSEADYEASANWRATLPTPATVFTNFSTADFNQDGVVDQLDRETWLTNFGQSAGVTNAHGDANLDGLVDAADYTTWRDELGYESPTAPIVPLPAALVVGLADEAPAASLAMLASSESLEILATSESQTIGASSGEAAASSPQSRELAIESLFAANAERNSETIDRGPRRFGRTGHRAEEGRGTHGQSFAQTDPFEQAWSRFGRG